MSKTPIDIMLDRVNWRCTECGAKAGACGCPELHRLMEEGGKLLSRMWDDAIALREAMPLGKPIPLPHALIPLAQRLFDNLDQLAAQEKKINELRAPSKATP